VLTIPEAVSVYLFTQATDMRRGFDRLAALVEAFLQRSVLSGGLFVFFSRRRDRVKILWWDGDGFCLWYKRLEQGTFRVEEREGCEAITGVDLQWLLRGMDFSRIELREQAKKGIYALPTM